jgi:hypothetical protein
VHSISLAAQKATFGLRAGQMLLVSSLPALAGRAYNYSIAIAARLRAPNMGSTVVSKPAPGPRFIALVSEHLAPHGRTIHWVISTETQDPAALATSASPRKLTSGRNEKLVAMGQQVTFILAIVFGLGCSAIQAKSLAAGRKRRLRMAPSFRNAGRVTW